MSTIRERALWRRAKRSRAQATPNVSSRTRINVEMLMRPYVLSLGDTGTENPFRIVALVK
jgi:hypothetical protein